MCLVQGWESCVQRRGAAHRSISSSESTLNLAGSSSALSTLLSIVVRVRANALQDVWMRSPSPSRPGLDSIIVVHLRKQCMKQTPSWQASRRLLIKIYVVLRRISIMIDFPSAPVHAYADRSIIPHLKEQARCAHGSVRTLNTPAVACSPVPGRDALPPEKDRSY
jgi:hypothetical protein